MSFGTHEMFDPLPPATMTSGTPHEKSAAGNEWQPIIPIPEDAPRQFPRHRLGKPSATWTYRDAQGHVLQHVCRWDHDGDKTFMPLVFCENAAGRREWRWLHPQAPRPLYGLDRLAERLDAMTILAEGEKSADAAAKLFPDHVAVTSSGGSNSAGQADWSPLAGRNVVIWPDNDPPGRKYASEASALIAKAGAKFVRVVDVPTTWPVKWDLADAAPTGVTVETLREMLAASDSTAPIPLVRPMAPPDPYPAEALGYELELTARALHSVVQSPLAMCANTVLATATLAAQAHVNVLLPYSGGASHPVSSLFVTIGKSGERKSATDEEVMPPVRAREAALRATYMLEWSAYENKRDAWEAGRKQALTNKDAITREADLAALGRRPDEPLKPILIMAEPTVEGLAKLLMTGQPSVGIFSAEGGQFVGGHAMKDDAKLRSAAALSCLWDGDPWKRIRAEDGSHTIADKRLALHLMLQPDVAELLVSDPVLRDQGLLSRMLVTFPPTTMGTRFAREIDRRAVATLDSFRARLTERLVISYPLKSGTSNELEPRALPMSQQARGVWWSFADHVEKLLAPGQPLEPISGFAAKMPEHAARLAAVLAWWSDADVREIDEPTMNGGIQLAQHYGDEALRLFLGAGVTGDTADAVRLLAWLHERWDEPCVSVPDIVQLGPNSLRVASHAKRIVDILKNHNWLIALPEPTTIKGKRRREAWRIVRVV